MFRTKKIMESICRIQRRELSGGVCGWGSLRKKAELGFGPKYNVRQQ